ncbi:MAG TPA: LacI family transcriptional regulator, partial [Ruminococcaceae bacterium]|nr:LacI family transcriptional regulator [Oscillospiraceae bacterium]
VISAVGVRNEYNIAYLGIKTAVVGIRRKKGENVQVNFIIADGTNLYSPENERILFPFVS